MNPTNEQIIAEAHRRFGEEQRNHDGLTPEGSSLANHIIEVMRENWTPPEPVVDPDLMAFREWAAAQGLDPGPDVLLRDTFLAGARMAREQFASREREMLAVLEEFSRDCDGYLDGDGHPWALLQRARAIIAKHKEIAR